MKKCIICEVEKEVNSNNFYKQKVNKDGFFNQCKPCHIKDQKNRKTYNYMQNIYKSMKQRCYNKNNFNYDRYGGRGIKVCDRWLNSYGDFKMDMGERPTNKHTLERINNNDGYSPENCKWATRLEQNQNMGKRINNTSGYVGVSWAKASSKWIVQIGFEGKKYNLGVYENIEDAVEARKQEEVKYWNKHAAP